MQYVKIDLNGRAYTYAWAGDQPLAVGEWVVVPGNSYNPNPSTGRVLRLLKTCDFTGKVTVLRQKVRLTRSVEQVDGVKGQVDLRRRLDNVVAAHVEDNVLGQESGPVQAEPHDWDDYGYRTQYDFRDEGHAQGQD